MGKPLSSPAVSHQGRLPKGTFRRLIGSASAAEHGHAYWNGSRWIAPRAPRQAVPRFPRLIPPPPHAGKAGKAGTRLQQAAPQQLDPSTQVDSPTSNCTAAQPAEPSVAQSSDNPDFVVVAAAAAVDASGACIQENRPWVFYSHDGGQHWREEIVPNLTAGLEGGDVSVVYDPKDHVFVYAFLQFNDETLTTSQVRVTRSSDGVSWSFPLILDAHPGQDKPMITVDQNRASPHFGRLLVAWRDDTVAQNALLSAFSDNGGGSWLGSSNTINTVPDCDNGASPAFDANGEAMVAWFDCNGGNKIEEALSTDGGASWPQSSSKVISVVNPISANDEDQVGDGCKLNAGGSKFRCNSFPSLAGDPNPLDAGGRAFFVVFANWEATTQGPTTANVSQLHGLSTIDGGANWTGGPNVAFDYMAPNDFGDKFMPWASFSPSGRLNVGYNSRSGNASAANPNGLKYDEEMAEATRLASLRNNTFITFIADGTLIDPGSSDFIGDYSGIESQDNDFDTFPVWTSVQNGVTVVRTMDLCYINCPAFLHPVTPVTGLHAPRTSFGDFYQFNTDSDFGGAGTGAWNAVGIRETTDFPGIDDSIFMSASRYFSPGVTRGDLPSPSHDYVLENDSPGHGPTKPYYVIVQPSGSVGGSYTMQWSGLSAPLDTSLFTDMDASDIIGVFQMADATGTTYHLGLRPSDGNTSSYRVSVHLNGNGTYQSSNDPAATSGTVPAGSPAFLTVSTGASPTGADALVVQNDNGGSGGFTLFRDTAAPSGTVSINSGAAATGSTNVTLNLSATNPTAGDPVSDMRMSSDGTNFGNWMPFADSASFTLPSGDGAKTVFVQYRNGAGAVSATASHSIILDTTSPVIAKAPAPSFKKGQMGSTSVPISLTWAGSDAASGISHYDVEQSVDGGAFSLVSSPTAANATVNLNPGHSYQFEVRATDDAGNVSGFTAGSTFTLSAVQETTSTVTYSAGWTRRALTGSFGGSVKFARLSGKKAVLSFSGSQVALVSTIGSDRGSATASLDGGTATTVSTNGTALKTAMVVYAKTVTAGPHSLVLTVLGTAGHPRVDVDGFLIIH